MLFETAFLIDFESGPFVADLLSVFILIIALRFTDLRSVLIILRFSNSSAPVYLKHTYCILERV